MTALIPDQDNKDWKTAALNKPISLGCRAVRGLRASGQRREAFSETITEGNTKKIFIDASGEDVTVPHVALLHDVDTHWDSVYFMIRRLRMLRPVRSYMI